MVEGANLPCARRSQVTLRARAVIDEEGKNNQIVIQEVPFQQTRERLCKAIADLHKEERIKGVREI